MIRPQDQAMLQRAFKTYPTMVWALLSAMRVHQRNDEPARDGTAPAVLPLAFGCVLAVRMSKEPGALELAEYLLIGAVAMLRGELPPGEGSEFAADVLRRLEERGEI